MDAPMGGEVTCYLSQLDEQGEVPDARRSIIPKTANVPPGTRCVTIANADLQDDGLTVLVPRPDESLHDYRERLEDRACRTAAWRIALLSEAEPVAIEVAGREADDPYVAALLIYLRSLLE